MSKNELSEQYVEKVIKDIDDFNKITIKGGDLYMTFERISPEEFKIIHHTDSYNICNKCGEEIINEEEHNDCEYEVRDQEYARDLILDLFDDDTIISFDDKFYIAKYKNL